MNLKDRTFKRLRTTRATAEELDRAIMDLEKRGWRLVSRTADEREYRTSDRKYSSFIPYYVNSSSMVIGRHTAVMEREDKQC